MKIQFRLLTGKMACDIPSCKEQTEGGLRFCKTHIGRHSHILYEEPKNPSGPDLLEDALLHLLWLRNTSGLFEGGAWVEPESGMAYDFLKRHLAEIQGSTLLKSRSPG